MWGYFISGSINTKDATGGEIGGAILEFIRGDKKTLYQVMNGTHEVKPQIKVYDAMQ